MKLNLGEILKLGLVKILKLKFCGEAVAWLRFWGWCLVEILRMKWSRFVFELMIWTQPSGPLCLWQCFATAALNLRLFCQKTIFEDMGSYSTHQNGCFPKLQTPGVGKSKKQNVTTIETPKITICPSLDSKLFWWDFFGTSIWSQCYCVQRILIIWKLKIVKEKLTQHQHRNHTILITCT